MPNINDWLTLKEGASYYYKQTGLSMPTLQTIRVWVKEGKRGLNGERVKLKAMKHSKHYMTRKAWVNEFIRSMGGVR